MQNDNVNHPAHYSGRIETIDIIESVIELITDPKAAFLTGQVLKYMCRWFRKNGTEDLKKAKWYLVRLISQQEEKK